jgi:hypothetical protein
MTSLDPGVTGRRRQDAAHTTAKKAKRKKEAKPHTQAKPQAQAQVKPKAERKRLEPPEGSPVMTIPAAGRKFFGLSKNGSYDAAERGDFGRLLTIGRRKYAVIGAIEAKIKAAVEATASTPNII